MEKQKRTRRSRSEKTETTTTEKPRRGRPRKVAEQPVVKTEEVKPVVTSKGKKKDYTEFYKKYPWVVQGSVREPTDEDKKLLPKCHGMVCTIKCVDTGKLRVINTQDAFQVKRTEEAALAYRKKKRPDAETKAA